MPTLMEQLTSSLDTETLARLGQQAGIDSNDISSAVQAALPAILSGLNKNAASGEGAEQLSRALQRDHDGSILDNLGSLIGNEDLLGQGQKILGHVFGQKQSTVARGVGQAANLSSDSMSQLMAMLAPLVMGTLGRQNQEKSLSGGSLSDLLGKEAGKLSSAQPQSMDFLSSLLDADGDGDVDASDLLNKVPGLLGGLFGKK